MSREVELDGMDLVKHREPAYPSMCPSPSTVHLCVPAPAPAPPSPGPDTERPGSTELRERSRSPRGHDNQTFVEHGDAEVDS